MNEPLRYTPSPDHRFWLYSPLYSPEGDGLTFWRTAEERDAYAKKEIRTYLDDNEWFEEVEGVIAGEVTHITQAVNIKRPSGEIDEDGYDEEENGPWESPDQVMCDYALVPLPDAAPAPSDGPAVPEGREPAAVEGEPSDEEIMELMPQQMHDDLAYAARAMANEAGTDSRRAKGFMRIALNRHAVDLARAVLARWGRPATLPAPAAGEVRLLVAWLGVVSQEFRLAELDNEATQTDRAATLLEHLSAFQAPQPVAVSGWQDIDTAPKDGTEILASDYDAIEIVSWVAPRFDVGITGEWTNREGEAMYPAWWQPLADHPPLPTTTPAGQEGA